MSSKKQKLTPWFVNGEKPVRKGYYQVWRPKVNPAYPKRSVLYWNGKDWKHTPHSGAGLIGVGGFASVIASHGDKWRGLAEDPNA